MIRLILIFLLMLYSPSWAVGYGSMPQGEEGKTAVVSPKGEETRKDGLKDGIDRSRPDPQAVLSDRQPSNRISSTRAQRVIPGNGTKPSRLPGRAGIYDTYRLTYHAYHDGRRRSETAPYPTAASCIYYVFALRRILC